MNIPLQPLRIPTGWIVHFNQGLYEVDPDSETHPLDELRWLFNEDMLQMQHASRNRLLDVGWYPSGNLKSGEYGLHLHEGDWLKGRLLYEFRTRDRYTLVAEIERILNEVLEGRL